MSLSGLSGLSGLSAIAQEQSWISSLDHAPRVLLVSDSILNSDVYIRPRLQSEIPGTGVLRYTYAGSSSPIGWLITANDVKSYAYSGNLFPLADITQWPSKTNCTVSLDASNGMYKVIASSSGARVNTDQFTGKVIVPTGATELTFSFLWRRGDFNSCTATIRSITRNATVLSQQQRLVISQDHLSDQAYRVAITAKSTDGAGFAAGEILHVYIYFGDTDGPSTGTCWVSEPSVTVGYAPTVYHNNSGTPDTITGPSYITPSAGFDRNLVDLTVIEFTNDSSKVSADGYRKSIEAIIAGALQFSEHVLVCTPPPQANPARTSFITGPYVSNGLYDALKTAVANTNVYFYDAIADFQNLVQTGAYLVSDLMRDEIHETDSSSTSAGMGRYVTNIAVCLRSPTKLHTPGSALPFARIGVPVQSGTWAWKEYSMPYSPSYDAHSLSGYTHQAGRIHALSATATGSLSTTTPACTAIGVIALNDQTVAGEVDVSIDGGSAVRLTLSDAGTANYPKGYWVATGLTNTTHTVTISWVSGEARVVGIVGF